MYVKDPFSHISYNNSTSCIMHYKEVHMYIAAYIIILIQQCTYIVHDKRNCSN